MKTLGILIAILTLFSASTAPNCITVRGRVVDADSGDPLIYCNVYLEGTEYVAQTDEDGTFLVRVPDSYNNSVLVAWSEGYDKFYMPLSKLNEEYVIIKLKETPIWIRNTEINSESQIPQGYAFTNRTIISLKRKSRFRIFF